MAGASKHPFPWCCGACRRARRPTARAALARPLSAPRSSALILCRLLLAPVPPSSFTAARPRRDVAACWRRAIFHVALRGRPTRALPGAA
eukprot:7389833-Prymnesium_polylepis.1